MRLNGPPSSLLLPNKSRGVARVNDARVSNGIFWVLRSGAPRDLPRELDFGRGPTFRAALHLGLL